MNDIIAFIKKYKTENPTGWRKWIVGSLVAVLTLVVVAVFATQAALRGRELAQLKTDRDKSKEDLHRAELNHTLAANRTEAAKHEAAAEAVVEAVRIAEERIKVLEEQHAANESVINSIRSWDDVDRVVKR